MQCKMSDQFCIWSADVSYVTYLPSAALDKAKPCTLPGIVQKFDCGKVQVLQTNNGEASGSQFQSVLWVATFAKGLVNSISINGQI